MTMPLGREGRQRDRLGGFAVDLGILARAPSPAMHHHHVVRLPLCKPRLRRISGLPARRACRSASVLPCVAHPCLERRGHGQHFSGKLDRTARPGRLGAGRRRARPEDCRQGAERALFVDLLARADLPQGCRVVDISPLLRHLIIAAIDIRQDYPAGGRDERVMELILDELRVLPILALHVPLPIDAPLASLCQALRDDPAGDWTLQRAARQLGVSGRTLTRAFQRETGLSFVQWLRRVRLLASLDALAAGHSIMEVALDLGYDSPSAFSAMFRRTLGVSPTAYFGKMPAHGRAEQD